MFVRYADTSIHLNRKQKLSHKRRVNTSYVTDLKDEHHDIYEKEEDKPPDDCLLNSKYNYLYVEKLPKYAGESSCFQLSSESVKQLIPTKTQKETNLR
jgi:hypothetical protein